MLGHLPVATVLKKSPLKTRDRNQCSLLVNVVDMAQTDCCLAHCSSFVARDSFLVRP
jgi:hypothetical protein